MITLQTNDYLYSDSNYRVLVGGDFEKNDLVKVYKISNPEFHIYSFQANYIKFGENYEPVNDVDLGNYKINDKNENPINIDYDILGFHKQRFIEKGELKNIKYFDLYNEQTKEYGNNVLTEYREYIRSEVSGLLIKRNQTVEWYLKDGSIGAIKNSIKYYTEEESINEGIIRRGNMVDYAKTTLLNELKSAFSEPTNQTYAFDLLTSVKTEMDYFEQGYTQPLRDAISASTKGYMLENIKIAVINQLTF